MKKTTKYLRKLTSFALLFSMLLCMLSALTEVTHAATSVSLSPLGSPTKKTVDPRKGHEFKVSFSQGTNGLSLEQTPPSWLSATKSGANYIVKVTGANTGTSDRTGSVVWKQTVGGKTYRYELKITQKAFTVSSPVSVPVSGLTQPITTNYPCTCTFTKYTNDWLTMTNSGNTSFKFVASPNTTGSSRSRTITFTYQLDTYNKVVRTITITQKANYITGVPGNKSYSNRGGSFDVSLSTGYGTVSIELSDWSWLHVKNRKGNSFTIVVDPNTTVIDGRSGVVSITYGSMKKDITVSQASCRTAIDFKATTEDSLQNKISNDDWDGRVSYLTAFFDGLYSGASNTSNPSAARYVISRAKTATVFPWTTPNKAFGYYEKKEKAIASGARNFEANHTYYGLAYQQFGKYFHYNSAVMSRDAFIEIAKTKSFSTLRGSEDFFSYGPSAGTDCSGYASYCIGLKAKETSYSLKQNADDNKGTAQINRINANTLKPGDLLWRDKHILIVASAIRLNGKLSAIAIIESRGRTTASGRNLHIFYDSDEALSLLFGGKDASTCREILKNVLYAKNDNIKSATEPLHYGTTDDFINSFSQAHMILPASKFSFEFEGGAPTYK
jgi:hypothetical protein